MCVDLVALIVVLIYLRLINSCDVISLDHDIEIEELHVLLANRMTIWYDNIGSFLQRSAINTAILISISALADQTLQLHATYLRLPLLAPKQNKTTDVLFTLFLAVSVAAPFPSQRYPCMGIFREAERILVIFGPLRTRKRNRTV